MKARLGLQSRFFAAILLLLAVVVLVMVLLWNRQQAAQHEVSEVTRVAMRQLLSEQVRMGGTECATGRRTGESAVLLRPGCDRTLARAALRESDVDYVLSPTRRAHPARPPATIAAYATPMSRALARR